MVIDKHGHNLSVGSYVFDGEGAARIYAIDDRKNTVTLLVAPIGHGINYQDRRRRNVDPSTLEFLEAALIDWPTRRTLLFTPDLDDESENAA